MRITLIFQYVLLIFALVIFDLIIKQYSATFTLFVGFFYELFIYFIYHTSIKRKINQENTFLKLSVTLLSISIVITFFRFFILKDYFGTGFPFLLVLFFYTLKFCPSFLLSYYISKQITS
jgi:hypothetical protein